MHKKTVPLECTCGAKVLVKTCNLLDVASQPKLEEELLRGELNAGRCPNCGKISYVDEPFIYLDSRHETSIRVLPRTWRGTARTAHPPLKRGQYWTRTFYGLDALINFIAAESNVPRKYRDQVADQAQTIADEYHAVSESRCSCGHAFKVEREFLARTLSHSPIDVVRTRCIECGETKTFYFPIPYVVEDRSDEEARVLVHANDK